MQMSQGPSEPLWKRFVIAYFSSAVLVFACATSMQLHVLRDPSWLLTSAAGTLIWSVPGAGLAALLFRKNQVALILGAQTLTVAALAVLYKNWA
jgi:hypothetical protein